jgi:hypothetical protein
MALGHFTAPCGARQAFALQGSIFGGLWASEFRPADRDIMEDAQKWAMNHGKMDAELIAVHVDYCSYVLVSTCAASTGAL